MCKFLPNANFGTCGNGGGNDGGKWKLSIAAPIVVVGNPSVMVLIKNAVITAVVIILSGVITSIVEGVAAFVILVVIAAESVISVVVLTFAAVISVLI